MADLLIEIICEEIPARMQARAAVDLERLMLARLKDAGLVHGPSRHFVAPRHLALYVEGLAERQEDISEERRGPRADAPDQAIAGFIKSTGLSRDQLVEEDTPKGRFLFARIDKAGAATSALLPDMITGVLADFPWPKSQRWGATRFRWVRPLHRVNVLFGAAPLAGELDLGGASLAFTATSRGHYFEHADDIDLAGVDAGVDAGFVIEQWQASMAIAVACVVGFIALNLVRGRQGRVWQAVRDDPIAAAVSGISPAGSKISAFVVSSLFAALAGAVFAQILTYVGPGAFTLGLSLSLLVGIVLGGRNSFIGAIIGAVILVWLPEFVLDVSADRGWQDQITNNAPNFIYGLLVVLVVLAAPGGIVGGIQGLVGRLRGRAKSSSSP